MIDRAMFGKLALADYGERRVLIDLQDRVRANVPVHDLLRYLGLGVLGTFSLRLAADHAVNSAHCRPHLNSYHSLHNT